MPKAAAQPKQPSSTSLKKQTKSKKASHDEDNDDSAEPSSPTPAKTLKKQTSKGTKMTDSNSASNLDTEPSRGKSNKPTYLEMVLECIRAQDSKKGTSKQAIVKYLVEHYLVDKEASKNHLNSAINAGVKNNDLKQLTGHGASGSFTLGENHRPSSSKAKASVTDGKEEKEKKPTAKNTAIKMSAKVVKTAKVAKPKTTTKASSTSSKNPKDVRVLNCDFYFNEL